jgi:hypothetical protein
MSAKNWTTRSFNIAQSGDSLVIRIDDPTTPLVFNVSAGSIVTNVASQIDGTLIENVVASATGVSTLSPTTTWGNMIVVTSASADAEFTILKLQ